MTRYPYREIEVIWGADLKSFERIKHLLIVLGIVAASGCATITNDPMIPLAVTFSDGSAGQCDFKNKRGQWSSDIPATNVMIRRSDDALMYECLTRDGREATGSIRSEMEGGKMAASVIFWDFGITDSITDKHRTYQGNVVIPMIPKEGTDDAVGESPLIEDESGVDPFSYSVGGDESVETSQEVQQEKDL